MNGVAMERHAAGGGGADERRYPRLLGERPCLNFVNTLDPRGGDEPRDYLLGYADLVDWSVYAGILPGERALDLLRAAEGDPARARAAFERAIDLREAAHRVFLAGARREAPPVPDLDALRDTYLAALARARLLPGAAGYGWAWEEGDEALDRPLWPIARSAIELLTAPEMARVKECANHGCGWLFLDTSKNGSRRWCSMEGCGSQVKGRRQYARRRAARGDREGR
jgi:predicted RNA-binding Zn ribbon-like protein